ncbi:uncharacterized protein LY79DRAFT_544085 [Colletotrichum navitas]|uniref:Uncharacterized protein n=1 Tax=Colletotrichum navitas TaxID=681940 RepID=A0AAD8Q6Q0_9PEZI|nr:uncharacterized protein LY79DRAFT_544085 [Colletotrichum navitas]KAK1596755.1 hypothetical protein LY79DRAFT_544085 [Colletotrichum navitas]
MSSTVNHAFGSDEQLFHLFQRTKKHFLIETTNMGKRGAGSQKERQKARQERGGEKK